MKSNGSKEWWINGIRSRLPEGEEDDLPHIIDEYDVKYWYNSKGDFHRDNGPAIDHPDLKMWVINGKLHREDGPAVIYKNSFIREYRSWMIRNNVPILECTLFRDDVITECWCVNGDIHRIGGPTVAAIINGKVDYRNQRWYIKGNLHRTDGAAYISDGCERYYINGVHLTKKEFNSLKEAHELGYLRTTWRAHRTHMFRHLPNNSHSHNN